MKKVFFLSTTRVWLSGLGLLLLGTCLADAALAQAPGYRNLRFEENNLLFKDRHREGLEELKYLQLDDAGEYWLSLGGSWRLRSEGWLGFQFEPEQNAVFGLSQARLHADLHLGQHVRLFTEAISALSTPRQLPGGIRNIDMDALDLQNLFVDLRWPLAEQAEMSLRLGRQEMDFGKERLLSSLRWVNTRRSFDALRSTGKWGGFQLDGLYAQLVNVDKHWFNTSSPAHSLYGLYGTGPLPAELGQAELYWLGLHRSQASFGGQSGREDRQTLGARLDTRWPWDLGLELESAWQTGSFGQQAIQAFFAAAELAYQPSWPLKPAFTLGLDYASGDQDPSDQSLNTFNQLFPLAHAYAGLADLLGRQNLIDLHTGLGLNLLPQWRLRLQAHAFWRASPADSLYQVNGAPLRAETQSESAWVGSELDLVLQYQLQPHWQFELGWSQFYPGQLIQQTGASATVHFAYLQSNLTF